MAIAGLLLLLASCLVFNHVAAVDRGLVYVDNLSWDKLIDGSKTWFIRVDNVSNYGDENVAFLEVALRVASSQADIIMGGLRIGERDFEKTTDIILDRLKIKKEDLPVFLLFPKGYSRHSNAVKPVVYHGNKKRMGEILSWLKIATGEFMGINGQLKELDALAMTIQQDSSKEHRQAAAEEAQILALKTTDVPFKGYAEYYVRVFQKLVDKPEYVAAEKKRLKKLITTPLTLVSQVEALQLRYNTLLSFQHTVISSKPTAEL